MAAVRFAVPVALLLLSGCSLFSRTPEPARRQAIRDAIPYGMSLAKAESKLSGLGFECRRRSGRYRDESGVEREALRFLYCEERPNAISFTCENRDQVTLIERDGGVAGIEVTRGPSCQQVSPPALQIQ